jgi:hypothetical protein
MKEEVLEVLGKKKEEKMIGNIILNLQWIDL